MVAFHKVNSVTALKPYMLIVQFAEGVSKTYDVSMLFDKWPAFQALQSNDALFARVHVDVGGHGIVWDDNLDLSCNELFRNGQVVDTEFDGLMACSDATAMWGLHESTLRKAIAYGRLRSGVDVCKFGKQWVVSRDAMIREFGPLDSHS